MSLSANAHDYRALLTESDVARRLGLKSATLRRWRWCGRGPRFIKVGAAVRYDPQDVRDYLAANLRISTSDPGPSVMGLDS